MKKKVQSKIAKCLCGGIKIKIFGKLRHVINCHCKQCMKTHGNFAAYTNCLEENIIFMNKSTLRWYNSSNFAKRGFCNKCGASIFFKFKNTDNVSIAAGMFNGKTGLKTMRNIFVGTKSDFYKITDKLPKYKRFSN